MEFQVPQFIEIEDKIFGPLTFRQFVYLLGGVGACYLLWINLNHVLAVVFMLPIAALAGALAFGTVNGRPFIHALESGFNYQTRRKLYLWKQPAPQKKVESYKVIKPASPEALQVPTINAGKLKDLAWSLDILEKIKNSK